ncbi:unnamed protein product [Pylaiella littoralis]
MNFGKCLFAVFFLSSSVYETSGFVPHVGISKISNTRTINTRTSNAHDTMRHKWYANSRRHANFRRYVNPRKHLQMVVTDTNSLDTEHIKASLIPALQALKHYSPFIVIYGIIIKILNKVNNSRSNPFNPLGGHGSSPGQILTESDVSFDDVAGCDYAKKELEEVVDFMKDPEKYYMYGAKLPRGILLSSQPGMGKTLMAKALAGESGVPLISVSGSEFVSIFVGNGPKRVREVHDLARKSSPCFVFMDEIDSVAGQRGASIGGGNDEREATLNQLLTEIDGMTTDTTIITIGATNRPDLLDSALTRPGRMDRRVEIGSHDADARRSILDVHFRNKPLDEQVDLDALSRQTIGMSGAALANIANEAAILAARDSTSTIDATHINLAFDKLTVGLRLPDRKICPKTLNTVAYHEAGHAIASYLVDSPDKVSRISVIPSTSGAAGFTMFTPSEEGESGLHSKKRLEGEVLVLLGGRAAEELVFGTSSVTTGAYDDIRRAKGVCQNIVDDFGMGGNISFNEFDSKNKAVEILNASYAMILGFMGEHRELLDRVTEELIEKKEILGDRFYEIVES